MYEVILSTVSTGRVVRKLFDSRDEADAYADNWLSKKLTPRPGQKPRSAQNYRVEIALVEMPAESVIAPARKQAA